MTIDLPIEILNAPILIKKNNILEKIHVDQIIYIKSEGNYCATITKSGEKYMNRISLSEYTQILNDQRFQKPHRSFLINTHLVDSINITDSTLLMMNKESIPISRNVKTEFLKFFKIII